MLWPRSSHPRSASLRSSDQWQLARPTTLRRISGGQPRSSPSMYFADPPWVAMTTCRLRRARPRRRTAAATRFAGRASSISNPWLGLAPAPARVRHRVGGRDLIAGHALPLAELPLAQPGVVVHGQPGDGGQRRGGVRGAAQVTGDDHVGSSAASCGRGDGGLSPADVVQRASMWPWNRFWRSTRSGRAARDQDAGHAGPATVAPSRPCQPPVRSRSVNGMCSQSFHSRSSE